MDQFDKPFWMPFNGKKNDRFEEVNHYEALGKVR